MSLVICPSKSEGINDPIPFNDEDRIFLDKLKPINNWPQDNIKFLFIDFDGQPQAGYNIKEKVNEIDVWPHTGTLFDNKYKKHLFMYPHLHVPRIIYLMNPQMALKCSIQYVFVLLYGEDMNTVKKRLFNTEPKLFGTFQILANTLVNLWVSGTKATLRDWDDGFLHSICLSAQELKNMTNCHALHLTQKVGEYLGLDLNTNISEENKKKFLKHHNRHNPYHTYVSYIANQCVHCLSEFDNTDELNIHMETCLNDFYTQNVHEGTIVFSCNNCQTYNMAQEQLIRHIFTFCVNNFRAICKFCNSKTSRCSCTKAGQTIRTLITEHMIENDKRLLAQPWNAGILSIYLSCMFNFPTIEKKVMLINQPEIKCKALIAKIKQEINFVSITPTKVVCFELSKAISHLQNLNMGLGPISKEFVHLGSKDPTYFLEDQQAFSYCPVCLNIETSETHMQEFHPKCCVCDVQFGSPDMLKAHFKSHKLKINCPQCGHYMPDLFRMLLHLDETKELENNLACPCMATSQCNLSGDTNTFHHIMYHAKDSELHALLDLSNTEHIPSDQGIVHSKSGLLTSTIFPEGYDEKTDIKEIKPPIINKELFCPNNKCTKSNISFKDEQSLNKHIQCVHKCPFPSCLYISTDDALMSQHIYVKHVNRDNTTMVQCTVCGLKVHDSVQLQLHKEAEHFLCCQVCGDSSFSTRQSLREHQVLCKNAKPESSEREEGAQSDPLLMLIDTLAQSKKVPTEELSAVKAMVLKRAERSRNPEIEILGNQTFFDLPCFPIKATPLTIPTARYKDLPKFEPVDFKPLKNYQQMYQLMSELCLLVHEYRLDEAHFVSLLVQRMHQDARVQLKSVLNTEAIGSVRLEKILETCRFIFYDLNIQEIYCASTRLIREPNESMINFFGRAQSITRLGSYFLEDPAQIQKFRTSNVRLQLLQNSSKEFNAIIRKRELENNIIYTSIEVLRIYMTFERNSSKQKVQINKMSSDISHQLSKNFNSPLVNRTFNKTPNKVRRFQGNDPNLKKNVKTYSTRNIQDNSKSKPKPETIEKLKSLGIPPGQIYCLLCGGKHISRNCKIYPRTYCEPVQCTVCKKHYHSNGACKMNNSKSRIVRN